MEHSKEQILALKRQYPHDTRVELQYMSGEPDMPEGLRGSVDFIDDIGQIHVDWDNGRTLALVSGEDGFRMLTFEEESAEWLTAKFYSPLSVQSFEVYDSEYLSDQRISGLRDVTDSAKYIDEITNAIQFNTRSYMNQEEFFISGISDYKVADNIMTLELSVEAHNNKLWGVTTLKHKYPFSQNQINTLKGYIEDEYENGWGNQFKHQDIAANGDGHYRINVHFWQDTADYVIMSEDEFNQIKASEPASANESVADQEQKSIFKVDLASNGYFLSVELPMSEYEMIQALYKIQCDRPDAEYTLALDQYHHHLGEYENLDLTGASLYELNHLAKGIADFDDYQKISFDAYMKSQDGVTVKQLINASHNINDIMWHPVGTDKELGEFALDNEMLEEYNDLPDAVYEMLDKEKAGAKFREQDGGKFVNGGYLTTNEFDEVYDGITLPDSKPLSPFQVCLCYDNENDNVWLDLPAGHNDFSPIADKYGVHGLENLYMYDFNTEIPYMNTMDCEISIEDFDSLNELAAEVKSMDDKDFLKFKAVLEAEQPFLISDAVKISRELDKYSFDPHLTHPNDYGKMMVCEKLGLDYDDALVQFVDNTDFGKELMARNGLTATQYGAVTLPPTIEEVQSSEDIAGQDDSDEDESEDQEFEGMQMT